MSSQYELSVLKRHLFVEACLKQHKEMFFSKDQ